MANESQQTSPKLASVSLPRPSTTGSILGSSGSTTTSSTTTSRIRSNAAAISDGKSTVDAPARSSSPSKAATSSRSSGGGGGGDGNGSGVSARGIGGGSTRKSSGSSKDSGLGSGSPNVRQRLGSSKQRAPQQLHQQGRLLSQQLVSSRYSVVTVALLFVAATSLLSGIRRQQHQVPEGKQKQLPGQDQDDEAEGERGKRGERGERGEHAKRGERGELGNLGTSAMGGGAGGRSLGVRGDDSGSDGKSAASAEGSVAGEEESSTVESSTVAHVRRLPSPTQNRVQNLEREDSGLRTFGQDQGGSQGDGSNPRSRFKFLLESFLGDAGSVGAGGEGGRGLGGANDEGEEGEGLRESVARLSAQILRWKAGDGNQSSALLQAAAATSTAAQVAASAAAGDSVKGASSNTVTDRSAAAVAGSNAGAAAGTAATSAADAAAAASVKVLEDLLRRMLRLKQQRALLGLLAQSMANDSLLLSLGLHDLFEKVKLVHAAGEVGLKSSTAGGGEGDISAVSAAAEMSRSVTRAAVLAARAADEVRDEASESIQRLSEEEAGKQLTYGGRCSKALPSHQGLLQLHGQHQQLKQQQQQQKQQLHGSKEGEAVVDGIGDDVDGDALAAADGDDGFISFRTPSRFLVWKPAPHK